MSSLDPAATVRAPTSNTLFVPEFGVIRRTPALTARLSATTEPWKLLVALFSPVEVKVVDPTLSVPGPPFLAAAVPARVPEPTLNQVCPRVSEPLSTPIVFGRPASPTPPHG